MIKQKGHFVLTAVVAMLVILTGCDTPSQSNIEQDKQAKNVIDGQYIVVLKNGKTLTKAPAKQKGIERGTSNRGINRKAHITSTNKMLSELGIDSDAVKNYYSHAVSGFSIKADDSEIAKLKKDSRVKFVEQDRRIKLDPYTTTDAPLPSADKNKNGATTSAAGDYVPYGITRVGGSVSGVGEYAWVIDTGIDLDHPDLNVNSNYSETFVSGTYSADDGNGHGTHVAGTMAAKNNGKGVIGVSPGATLFAVRVLDANGSGSNSGVIAGVDYVARNAYSGEVANMSLGGGISQALDNAVQNAANAGVVFSIAAGNSSSDANYSSPGRVNNSNVVTISAIDSNDNFASFSNYGNPPIDAAEPGVDVWSTWKNGKYNQISGTSMAAPHAGGLLITGGITGDGYANGDPDGNADPIGVRN